MQFTILLTFALLLFSFSVGAQTTADCAVKDCTPFLNLVRACGVDLGASPDQLLTPTQDNCICNGPDSRGLVSACVDCIKLSTTIDSNWDSFAELCTTSHNVNTNTNTNTNTPSSGSRSCDVFGGASYIVGGLMAGVGILRMAI